MWMLGVGNRHGRHLCPGWRFIIKEAFARRALRARRSHGSALHSWATSGELSRGKPRIPRGRQQPHHRTWKGARWMTRFGIDDQSASPRIYDLLLARRACSCGGSVGINVAAARRDAPRRLRAWPHDRDGALRQRRPATASPPLNHDLAGRQGAQPSPGERLMDAQPDGKHGQRGTGVGDRRKRYDWRRNWAMEPRASSGRQRPAGAEAPIVRATGARSDQPRRRSSGPQPAGGASPQVPASER